MKNHFLTTKLGSLLHKGVIKLEKHQLRVEACADMTEIW
jgi:hypothetical protein